MGQARVREILMQIFKIVVIVFCYDWAGEGERNSVKGEKILYYLHLSGKQMEKRVRPHEGYYWDEYLPYTVENIAVGINPDIDIWNNYLMLLRLLLITISSFFFYFHFWSSFLSFNYHLI